MPPYSWDAPSREALFFAILKHYDLPKIDHELIGQEVGRTPRAIQDQLMKMKKAAKESGCTSATEAKNTTPTKNTPTKTAKKPVAKKSANENEKPAAGGSPSTAINSAESGLKNVSKASTFNKAKKRKLDVVDKPLSLGRFERFKQDNAIVEDASEDAGHEGDISEEE
ncbi:MAG: hypothetical protein M1833_003330 [Piccolia ochrophora]|nr:MAG: hypothetical protein M1833_003330 [Piccolia ochrophora]